jgi:hypothetical protein
LNRSAEQVELELCRDLETLDERFTDEEFSSDVYRALASTVWHKPGNGEDRVSVSWKRAEEIVNELRARHGRDPLPLAQTGGEGEISSLVAKEIGRLGWEPQPLDTGSADAEHQTRPKSPPPADQGERHAPVEDPHAWERLAREEAEQNRAPTTPERPQRPED